VVFSAQKKQHLSEPKEKKRYDFSVRFLTVLVFFGFFTVALFFQMFRWQVLSHDRLASIADSLHTEERGGYLTRGTIYASDGSVLAYDEPAYDIVISVSRDNEDIAHFNENKSELVSDLSKILGEDRVSLANTINEAKSLTYIPLVKGVSIEEKRIIDAQNYYGVTFETSSLRKYPNGSLAAHVLGFVGLDKNGKPEGRYGIEGYYSDDLTGKAGVSRLESDFTGNVTLEGNYESIVSQESKELVLTIDTDVQAKVEEVLKEGIERFDAASGSVIVMNPETGAIIAMANYPTFDPNKYSKVRDVGTYMNKTIADSIESGSVFKPLVIAAGLETEAIKEDFTCIDDKGYLEIGDWRIHTWDRNPDGKLTLGEILSNSNNVCAARVGLEVGKQPLFDFYTKLGIGQHIGINMQGEGNNYMRPASTWGKSDLAVVSFGQAVTATNLQLISAHSTIANDGKRMQPYIVSEVRKGEEVSKYTPFVVSDVMSEETASKVRDLMKFAVENGEARFAFKKKKIDKYHIAGKTGTALIADPKTGTYIPGVTNTLFVGMAPSEDPKMVMLVRVERPRNETLSAYNVLPLWSDIFKEIKGDLGLQEYK
jgi:cell division protein FtsI/penicillin-binding protein 2